LNDDRVNLFVMGFSRRTFTLADRRRALRRRNEYICRIDMSPLLAVLISLWLVLMQATPYPHSLANVDLPQRLHAESLPAALREDAMRLVVSRDGRYFFGREQVSLDELAARIRAGVRDGAEPKVYLAADRRAKYRQVESALAEVGRSGVTEIGILTN
jgi:biopolymer transport protein ExbD